MKSAAVARFDHAKTAQKMHAEIHAQMKVSNQMISQMKSAILSASDAGAPCGDIGKLSPACINLKHGRTACFSRQGVGVKIARRVNHIGDVWRGGDKMEIKKGIHAINRAADPPGERIGRVFGLWGHDTHFVHGWKYGGSWLGWDKVLRSVGR